MATDKLDIDISAKGADTATASLNKLDGALARLDKSLGRIQSANIDKIVSELNKFNSVKISKSLADNLNSLSGAISSLAYTPNVEKLGSIASAISKLNGVKVSTSVATSLDGVSEALNKVSDKSDTGGINDVIKSVTGLNGIKISKSVGSGIESIVDSVNNISEVKPVSTELATNLTTLGTSLQSFKDISGLKISSTLGKGIENIATGINNISEVKPVPPQLATNLTILGGALQSFAGLQGIQFSGVAQLTTALSKMGKIKPISNTIYDNVDKVAKAIQNLNTKLKDIDNDRLNALAKATKAIAPSMREADRETRNFGSGLKLLNLEAFINLASRAIDKMKEIARTTSSVALEYSKLENSMSFYNRSLGAHSNEQLKVLKRYAEVGAIDMDDALQQIASMNNMLTGFGHSSENAAKMSRILYQVATDASFAIGENGKDVQAKFENLMSAMAGMPRVLYNWGVDTTITAMIDGFDDATRSMTKFEKSAYAYQIILNNTRAIQGQFSREYNLAATQQYVMQNKVKQSMAALGKAIQPFFLQMIKVGLVAVKVIDLIIMGLSRLFNFEYEPINYDKLLGGMEASVEGAETAAGGVSDGLEGGAKAAKDIQKYLAGFDDLNVMTITKDTGGTGAGAVGGGGGVGEFDLGDYDLLGGLYDDMRDMFKEIDKDAESFYKKLKLITPLALGIGAALLAWKVTTKFLTGLTFVKAGLEALQSMPIVKKGIKIAIGVTLGIIGVTMAISGIKDAIIDGWNTKNFGMVVGGAILTSIGVGIVASALGAGTILAGIIGAAVGGLFLGGLGIAKQFVTDNFDFIGFLMTTLGLAGGGAAIGAIIGMLGGPIGAGVGALIGLAVGIVATGIDTIKDNWEELKTFFTNFWESVKTITRDAITTLVTFFTEDLPTAVNKFFTEDLPYALGYAIGKLTAFVTKDIPDFFKSLTDKIKNFVTVTVPNQWNSLVEFFTEKVPAMFNSIKDKTVEKLEELSEVLKTFFTVTVPNQWNKFVEFTKSIPSKIKSAVGNGLDVLYNFGKDVLQGLLNGITDAISNIGSFFGGIKDKIVDGFQDAMDIHSPSRVMKKEVGYFMGLGIAEGVKDASGEVSKSVKGLTDVRFNGLDDNFISMLMGWKKSWLNAWKEMSESAGATLNGIGFATPSYDTKPMYQTVRRQGETTSGNGETLRAIAGEIIQAIYDSRTDEEDGDVVVELDGRVLGRFYDEHIKNKNARAGRTVVV